MKVVDMHGACLPSISFDYPVIHELTDSTFETAADLAMQLKRLYENP
jgi:hypothetical protein